MKGYRSRCYLIPVLLASYSVIAIWGGSASQRGEFFPVFNWSLFSYVSDQRSRYELEITELNGTPLPQATFFYDLTKQFHAARRRDVTFAKLVRRMGTALHEGDDVEFQRLRQVMEQTYLNDQDRVTYQIVLSVFHPIERWKHGTVSNREILGSFRTRPK